MKNESLKLYFHASSYEVYSILAGIVLFIISLALRKVVILSSILQIIASVLCLLPFFPDIISGIENKKFLNYRFIITLSFVLLAVSGYIAEGTAMVLIYSVFSKIVFFAKFKTDEQLKSKLEGCNETDKEAVLSVRQPDSKLALSIISASSKLPYLVLVIALLYIILVPVITNISFRMCIHRAVMALLLISSASFIKNLLYSEKFAFSELFSEGIRTNSLNILEKINKTENVIIDYTVFLDYEADDSLLLDSNVFDRDTFAAFLAHCVFNCSNLSIAEPVLKINKAKIQNDIIRDFKEYPGCGVSLTIGNAKTLFGRRELLEYFGAEIDVSSEDPSETYYLCVSGRYAGKVVPRFPINEDVFDLTEVFRNNGYKNSCLISELDNDEVNVFAENHNFDLSFGNCNLSTKINAVNKFTSEKGKTLFVFRDGFDKHTAALVDLQVGNRLKSADICISQDSIGKIGSLKNISGKFKNTVYTSTIAEITVKALLLFFALSGLSKAWFIVLTDISFEILTYLFISFKYS